jgi:hypothetical protein
LNVIDAAAIGLCERIEQRMGARAALAAFRPLITRVAGGGARVRAILGALRCAVALGDEDEVGRLADAWSTAPGDDRFGDIVALSISLSQRGLAHATARLAVAESTRDPRARAHYLAARCLEGAGDPAAIEAFSRAAEKAAIEGEIAIATASRARRIETLAATPATRALALIEATACDPSAGSPSERLVIARVRLDAPSPFSRATALSMLEELARLGMAHALGTEPRRVAAAAVELAADHADELGVALGAVEVDRIAATLRHWPDASARMQALARLDALAAVARTPLVDREEPLARAAKLSPEAEAHLVRARAVIGGAGQGRFPGTAHPSLSAAARLGDLALDAVASEAHARPADAAAVLASAREILATSSAFPAALWTAVRLCAASEDARLRAEAGHLGEALLSRRGPAPARGYTSLVAPLETAGRADLAERALRAAVRAREAGAADDLGEALVREGFRLAEAGERDAAVAKLREARETTIASAGRR